MANENVHVFNDLNFDDEVIKSDRKVLVDFTATWCGPCKRLSPIVDEVASELGSRVKIGKLDVDEAPITASKFRVQGVPTLLVFQNGEIVDRRVGLVPKSEVLKLLGEA